MPTQSMTGFGQGEAQGSKFTLNVELKTVNHRFKDIRFKMSNLFNAQEIPLRQKLESIFARGSFDIYVSYKKNVTEESSVELDYQKIQNFISKMQNALTLEKSQYSINPTDFMRSDFYQEDESKEDELVSLLEKAFEQAIESLNKSRQLEGSKLVEKLCEHRDIYVEYYSKIQKLKDTYQDKVKEKLAKRFETDAKELNIDEPRFLQEVIYYLEKLDVDEEINRISIHLEKLNAILASNDHEVGRQIDFLIQELNRETNTIGSKSGSSDISENVVQMKVQLEKIREQALNLQ